MPDSNREAAKRTAEFLFTGFDAGSLLSPKSTIEDNPNPMLRDAFMTPTAGPEEVWEQFGMSKVRSIKARGYQSRLQAGSAAYNFALRDSAPGDSHDLYRFDYSGSALGTASASNSRCSSPSGTICGRAAPYG